MMVRRTLAVLLIGFGALVVACGGDGGTEPPPPSGPVEPPPDPSAPTTAQVAMQSSQDDYGEAVHTFNPVDATIQRTGTVTWSNDSGQPHNVTFVPRAGAPSNIPDRTSGSESRTFNTTGEFDYSCTNHAGMVGKVVVVPD
jgi:plastocyanin